MSVDTIGFTIWEHWVYEHQLYPRLYASNVWREFVAEQLAAKPACEAPGCRNNSCEVHHRTYHRGCWVRFVNDANTIALCGLHGAVHVPGYE